MSNTIYTDDEKEVGVQSIECVTKTEQTEDGKMGNRNKNVVVPEQALETESVAQKRDTQIEDVVAQTTVAVSKTLANVDYIKGRLMQTLDFDLIVKELMDMKPAYKARKDGDKILLRQVKNIYKFTQEGQSRFVGEESHHKLVFEKETKLLREMTKEEIEAKKITG